jgi:hypothetical protein
VEINGLVLLPVIADFRQLVEWGNGRALIASPRFMWTSSSVTISRDPRRLSLSPLYRRVSVYFKNVMLAIAFCPRSSIPERGTIISASKLISGL